MPPTDNVYQDKEKVEWVQAISKAIVQVLPSVLPILRPFFRQKPHVRAMGPGCKSTKDTNFNKIVASRFGLFTSDSVNGLKMTSKLRHFRTWAQISLRIEQRTRCSGLEEVRVIIVQELVHR